MNRTNIFAVLCCVLLSMVAPYTTTIYAASSSVVERVPSEGTRFWVTFLSNNNGAALDETQKVISLTAAGERAATITVTYSVDNTTETTSIAAGGGSVKLELDNDKAYNLSNGTTLKTVLVESTDTISLFASVQDGGYYESTYVLPEEALGTEYVVLVNRRNKNALISEFAVVATEDYTTLHITKREVNEVKTPMTPSASVTSRQTVSLNKGQVYVVKSKSNTNSTYYNLSASTVASDKPVAVFSADEGSLVPYVTGGLAQNYLSEQMAPISSWGKEFVAVKPKNVRNNIVRIVSAYPNTEVTIKESGGNTQTVVLDSFSIYEYPRLTMSTYSTSNIGDMYITSTQPIAVCGYVPNTAYNILTDEYDNEITFGAPSEAWIAPMRQGVNAMTFATTPYLMGEFYANIVVPTEGVSSMQLDGASIADAFSTLSGTDYSIARVLVTDGKHALTNAAAQFVTTVYGYGDETGFYFGAGFNLAPASPKIYIDETQMEHNTVLEYCNRHPGVDFSAIVDYPHDSIRWYLGEDATSTEFVTRHMYGMTVGETDSTHNIRFFVYHHSPLSGVKDTDSICVSLVVHPVYYDTLETWVSRKTGSYQWTTSSEDAFNLGKLGQITLGEATDILGKTIHDKQYSFPGDADTEEVLWDSLYYRTRYDCDSTFYLKLHITPNIIMPTEVDTVCQTLPFVWSGHGSFANFVQKDKSNGTIVSRTEILTDAYGDYELRDTLISLVAPYPDSIHILNLRINPKPALALTNRTDSLCEGTDDSWQVPFTCEHADTIIYALKSSDYSATILSGGMRVTADNGSFTLDGLKTLLNYGTYKLVAHAMSDEACVSDYDTIPLVINMRPGMGMSVSAPQCFPAGVFSVSYTPFPGVIIDSLEYTVVYGASSTVQVATTRVKGNGGVGGSFTIDASDTTIWKARDYSVKVTPLSNYGCPGDEVTRILSISPRPVFAISSIDNQCAETATTTVAYTASNNTLRFSYYIKSLGASSMTVVQPVSSPSGSFALDISTVQAGVDTLIVVACSDLGCNADTLRVPFEIYPKPEVTITSTTEELSGCAPCDADRTISYTTTAVDSLSWQLTRGGAVVLSQDLQVVPAVKSVVIDKALLATPGTYTFSITRIKSVHDCEVADPATISFSMYNAATVSLGHIDSVCCGSAAQVPYQVTYTDTLYYTITKGGTSVYTGKQHVSGDGALSLPTTLAAGDDYAISVVATNTHNCGSSSADATFTINALPSITLPSAPDSICEEVVAYRTVGFSTTGAQTVTYSFSREGGAVIVPNTTITASVGEITLITDTLLDGTYILSAYPTSEYGCNGDTKTMKLVVKNRPTIVLSAVPKVCRYDYSMTVDYTASADAAKWSYQIYSLAASSIVSSRANQTVTASGEMEVFVWDLNVGDYQLIAQVTSDLGCVSEPDTIPFTVYVKPTIEILTADSSCYGVDSVKVTYEVSTEASTISYSIYRNGVHLETLNGHSLGTGSKRSGLAIRPIGSWSYTEGEYKVVMSVATLNGCESDKDSISFPIYPLPTVSLTTDNVDACYPVEVINVAYTSTNAATYSYTLTKEGESTAVRTVVDAAASASGTISLNTDGLSYGSYVLRFTALSEHDCAIATAQEKTIKILKQPGLTLNPISNICQNTATLTATYTMTDATKYDYEVTFGGSTFVSQTNQTAATITLPTATWEAGVYTLFMTAISGEDCGSETKQQSFTIYPAPTVVLTPNTVCETEASVDMAFSGTDLDSLIYSLKKGSTEYLRDTVSAEGGVLTLSTGLLSDGEYTLYVTPVSEHDCLGEEQNTTLTIYNQPTVSITPIADHCYADPTLTVAYSTSADAVKYAYNLLNSSAAVVRSATDQAVSTPGSFDIDIHELASGDYTLRMQVTSDQDCLSKWQQVSFTINDTVLYLTTDTICLNESYTWHGHTFSGSELGTGVHTIDSAYTSVTGCDSIYRLVLTIGQSYEIPETMTICENKPFSWRGHSYAARAEGTYTICDSLHTETFGCDSVYVLTLTVTDSEAPIVTNHAMCYGESFDWVVDDCDGNPLTLMRGLTATTHQVDTLTCPGTDCNPIYELNLTVYPEYRAADEHYTLCAGETLLWHNQLLSSAGTYNAATEGVAPHDCDSVYRAIVRTVDPESMVTDREVCYGEDVVFNYRTYTGLPVGYTTLLDTVRTADGCDSLWLRLNVTVSPRYYDSVSVVTCDSYYWSETGVTYTTSGVYSKSYVSKSGCDSTYVLNLTVNNSFEEYETHDVSEKQMPLTLHDYTYTNGGTYDRQLHTVGGCDSVYHITINVHPVILPCDTHTVSRCDKDGAYTWRGTSYSQTGTYSKSDEDSIHVLQLTVNKSYSDTSSVSACSSYTWYGTPYSTSGTYTHPMTSVNLCDSNEVLVLTINHPSSLTVNTTACQGVLTTIGNSTFVPNNDTTFSHTLHNSAGCDSVVTYNVSVTPRHYATPDDVGAFCAGNSYLWHGHTYTKGGTYHDLIVDANGCATTIYTLHLTENATYHIDEDVEVSELALPYTWHGHLSDTLLSTNGDYYEYLTSAVGGCDSVHHIHFHVNFVTRDTVQLSGCDSVQWNSVYYHSSVLASDTVYTDALHTDYQQIHFADITVYNRIDIEEPAFSTCQNEPFTWHGQTYNSSNLVVGWNDLSYKGTTIHGCDSVYTSRVMVYATFADTAVYAACPSELPYNWRGKLLSTAGFYSDSLTSTHGCDSVYVINFTVQTVTAPTVTDRQICQESSTTWQGMTIEGVTVGDYVYYSYYTVPGECDSTYRRLNLTVLPTYHVGGYDTAHICLGDSYLWYGVPREVSLPAGFDASDLSLPENYTADFDTIRGTEQGCDSLEAHLHLVAHRPYTITDNQVACDSMVWGDTTIFNSGIYTKHFNTVRGCDSAVTLTLTVYHSLIDTLTAVTACDDYYWPLSHQRYTESGYKEYRVPQLGGYCDSIVVLPLTINKTKRDTAKIVWCHEFAWAETSVTYHESGIYQSPIYTAANGCDSINYLLLTLQDSVVVQNPLTGCDTYTLHGQTYTSSTVVRELSSAMSGCDSITYHRITINHSSAPTYDTLSACRIYDKDGEGYTVTTDDVLTLTNSKGCDSVVYRHIVVNHPDTIRDTLTACDILYHNGVPYTYSGDFVQDYSCDSVVLLNLTINRSVSRDTFVTAWDSYLWEGTTYTSTTVDTKTLHTYCGCDSVVTLHLTINSSMSDEEWQDGCKLFDWEWSGETYYTSCDTSFTQRIDVGLPSERDSTRTLHLTIDEPSYEAFADTACDYYVWHGVTYYRDTVVWYNDQQTCDHLDTLHLTVYHQTATERYDTVCDVATIYGESFYRDTTFMKMLATSHGCDSVVTYHLHFNYRTSSSIQIDTCGSYEWEGQTYTRSGKYTRVLTGSNGCDSVVTLTLGLYPTYDDTIRVKTCESYYVWHGQIYTASGDYTEPYTTIKGCDSIITLSLRMPSAVESEPLDTTVCDGLLWNGKYYNATGAYSDTLVSSIGCDSVAWLYLNLASHPESEFSATALQQFTWGSETYYMSGDYQQRFATTTGLGCDSLVTLHLTITDSLPITLIADTACDAYTWDTETFYQSGTYTRNFPTIDGIDSVVSLSLVINHDTTVYLTDEACGSYYWNDEEWTESGIYTRLLQRSTGCDSVVVITLTIFEAPDSTSFVMTARDVYTWEGQTLTESGTYTHHYPSANGCDSVSTLYLTIIKNIEMSLADTACSEYQWADSVFTRSTIHTHVYPASNGCDSIVTMTIIVNEPVWTTLYDTACNVPYYFGGQMIYRSGIYVDTLASAVTGCDSIVTLYFQWCNEIYCVDSTTFHIEVPHSYTWDGIDYTTTGTYSHTYELETGCDSVSTMRLTILPDYVVVSDEFECDSLFWRDNWYYESGFYRDTVLASTGSDSILVLHAFIGHSGADTLDVLTCDILTLNGETFTESGTYLQHLTTVSGCDSLLTINLRLEERLDTTVADSACDMHVWNGATLTESGFYPAVFHSETTGCDSVVELHLIVYGSKQVEVIDTLHCDSLVWEGDTIYTGGIYTKVLTSTAGCDSTVTIDLRLLRHETVIAPDTASCDSMQWNSLLIFESGTYTDTLTAMVTGCDSIVTVNVTINPTLFTEELDSVAPPYYIWPMTGDTLWESGDYVDTVASLVTGCDSIHTLHLVLTDSIILNPVEPVRIDTFGYCPGDTVNIWYNLIKGHPNRYTLIFDGDSPIKEHDPLTDFVSVFDTTALPNRGLDSLFVLLIPDRCPVGTYCATLQLFDDFSSSEEYHFCLTVGVKGVLVTMWTDVIAVNNYSRDYIGYQWYRDGVAIEGATKQYFSDGEDVYGCYRARLQLADSSFIYTCEECFDLRSDSLSLIAYPTPAPVGQPVTLKAIGILIEHLQGASLTVTNVQGLTVHNNPSMTQRTEEVSLSAGLYIATLVTDPNNDRDNDGNPRTRTVAVKFTVF